MQYFEGEFSGTANPICTSGRTITLNNAPPATSLSWSVSPSHLIHSSTRSGNGSSAFIKAASSSSRGWVTITFHEQNDCNFFNTSVDVWVGKPENVMSPESVTGPSCVVVPSTVQYFAEPWPTYLETIGASGISTNWAFGSPPSGVTFTDDANRLRVDMTTSPATQTNQYYTFSMAPENACGTSAAAFVTFQTKSSSQLCGGGKGGTFTFMVSPNPAQSEIEITFEDSQEMISYFETKSEVLKVEISNHLSEKKYKGIINKNGISIDVTKIPSGLYIVRVTGKAYDQTARLIIE